MTIHARPDGDVLHLEVESGRGNILDLGTLEALAEVWPDRDAEVRAVVLRAAGTDFGWGSSIQDHRADRIEASLATFSRLLHLMASTPAPILAVVQGRCLGGGLELVLGCDLVVATPDTELGLPEITLGVFPPLAAALLPPRIGAGRATELMLTGRRLKAVEAEAWGLVQRVATPEETEGVVEGWISGFAATSRVALRHAILAARAPVRRALETDLPTHLARYLDRLCTHPDGFEGVEAFLAKRPPRWSDGS